MNLILAEIMPKGGVLWDSSHLSAGNMLAVLIVLLLICIGITIDFALVTYCIKRPSRLSDGVPPLTKRALPGKVVLLLVLVSVGLYLVNSLVYGLLFPASSEVEPHTILFQMLFLQIPVLLILFGVVRSLKTPDCDRLGLGREEAGRMLCLSAVFYLAAFPLLLFYNWLYQIFLDQLGYEFYLQDVSQVFLMPMSGAVRAAIFFAAIIAAPVFEEIIFRGVLFPWLVRRTGFWPGVLLISIFFAGMHLHLPSFLPLFLLSVMFCVAYTRTRSLWVPIGMHACFNAVSVLLLTLMG